MQLNILIWVAKTIGLIAVTAFGHMQGLKEFFQAIFVSKGTNDLDFFTVSEGVQIDAIIFFNTSATFSNTSRSNRSQDTVFSSRQPAFPALIFPTAVPQRQCLYFQRLSIWGGIDS